MTRRRKTVVLENVETKVLYKKSNITMHTYSRTCSGVSQCTRSGNGHVTKKPSRHRGFYVDGDKLKRDLSIETDICVLRRYCMRKRNKVSRDTSSAKSRYSNFTEIDVINEFNSEDGDGAYERRCTGSESLPAQASPATNDVTDLMLKNFKSLLYNWIEENFKENTDAEKEKCFDKMLSSYIRKSSRQLMRPTSGMTYILENERKKRKMKERQANVDAGSKVALGTGTRTTQSLTQTSLLDFPIFYNNIKIISTLSIPRNIHRDYESNMIKDPAKRAKKSIKGTLVPQSKDSHSYDKGNVATKLWVRRSSKKKPAIVKCCRQQKSFPSTHTHYSFTSVTTVTTTEGEPEFLKGDKLAWPGYTTNKENAFTMPTLVQKFMSYTASKATSHNSCHTICAFTCTSPIIRSRMEDKYVSQMEIQDEEFHMSEKDIQTSDPLLKTSIATERTRRKMVRRSKRNFYGNKIIKRFQYPVKNKSTKPNFESIRHKDFTMVYNCLRGVKGINKNEFFKYFNDIMKYVNNCPRKRDIVKLDIHVNVTPIFGQDGDTIKDLYESGRECQAYNSQVPATNYKTTPENCIMVESDTCCFDHQPGIIPLLDSTASHAKYLCERESSTQNRKPLADRSTTTLDLQISKEIAELRTALKELAVTTEKLIKGHIAKSKIPVDAATLYSARNFINATSTQCSNYIGGLTSPDTTNRSTEIPHLVERPVDAATLYSARNFINAASTQCSNYIGGLTSPDTTITSTRDAHLAGNTSPDDAPSLYGASTFNNAASTQSNLIGDPKNRSINNKTIRVRSRVTKSRTALSPTFICNCQSNYVSRSKSDIRHRHEVPPERESGYHAESIRLSKGTQPSSEFRRNQKLNEGKLKREGKRSHTWESETNLKLRSTSYRIIDSESLINVTDMTGESENIKGPILDKGMTCSLPRSRSLFEISDEKNRNSVLTYYCRDDDQNLNDFVYESTVSNSLLPCQSKHLEQNSTFLYSSPHYHSTRVSHVYHLQNENTVPINLKNRLQCAHDNRFVCNICHPELFITSCPIAHIRRESNFRNMTGSLEHIRVEIPLRNNNTLRPSNYQEQIEKNLRGRIPVHRSQLYTMKQFTNPPVHFCHVNEIPAKKGFKTLKTGIQESNCAKTERNENNRQAVRSVVDLANNNNNNNPPESPKSEQNRQAQFSQQPPDVIGSPIRLGKRRQMNIVQGIIYCFVMWIPIVIILALIFNYAIRPLRINVFPGDNYSKLIFSKILSDLGF